MYQITMPYFFNISCLRGLDAATLRLGTILPLLLSGTLAGRLLFVVAGCSTPLCFSGGGTDSSSFCITCLASAGV